jgi:hypothetical protein
MCTFITQYLLELVLLHATGGVLPRVSIIQMGKHNVKNPAVVFVLKRHGHEPFVGEYIEQVRVLETHHLVVQHCMFAWIVQQTQARVLVEVAALTVCYA